MLSSIQNIYQQAVGCDDCFVKDSYKMTRGKISKAQPRWIGKNYFSSKKRVCVMAINPGNVGNRSSYGQRHAAEEFQNHIENFANDQNSWSEMMRFIENDMHNWGGGRYKKFYFDLMGLDLNEVAMMNMMLCSATNKNGKGNNYSKDTLMNCYERFTKRILIELNPNFIILSGTLVQNAMKKFTKSLLEVLPNTEIINTFHYRPQLQRDWEKADKDAEHINNYLFSKF